jgi:Flp pilus assembly protein protease CpaA
VPLVLLFISIFDIRHHRIPNFSICLVLFFQLLLGDIIFNAKFLFPLMIFAVLSRALCNLGGGDIKLICGLAIFCVPRDLMAHFIMGIVVCSFLTLSFYALRYRNPRIAIPLAPAISGGYLWSVGF